MYLWLVICFLSQGFFGFRLFVPFGVFCICVSWKSLAPGGTWFGRNFCWKWFCGVGACVSAHWHTFFYLICVCTIITDVCTEPAESVQIKAWLGLSQRCFVWYRRGWILSPMEYSISHGGDIKIISWCFGKVGNGSYHQRLQFEPCLNACASCIAESILTQWLHICAFARRLQA